MIGDLTFAMLKPDAVRHGYCGKIITIIEQAGFTIQAMKLTQLTHELATLLYQAHREQVYYATMCAFIISGPVVPMVLANECKSPRANNHLQ